MQFDTLVAQAVAWANVMQQALHARGPWTFRTEHGVTPAHRIVNHAAMEIVFHGVALGLGDEQPVALYCGDDLITVTTVDLTQGNQITWKLLANSRASTS